MPVVTVTSDWNKRDFYAGALEGRDYWALPLSVKSPIRSIPLTYAWGVFVLRQAFTRYPAGSIHILAVQSQATDQLPMSVAYYQEHYFITVNDGRFSLLFDHEPQWIRAVFAAQGTFSELDAYIKAVKAIVEDKLGEMTLPADMKTEVRPSAVAEKDYIMGQVIYIDSYGNAITNVSRSLFDKVGAGRDFRIFLQGPYTRIEKISDSYGGVRPGQLLALFNSAGLLELAVFMGSLATLENIGLYDDIQIQFNKHG